jgi:hypothetical protein
MPVLALSNRLCILFTHVMRYGIRNVSRAGCSALGQGLDVPGLDEQIPWLC